jgi:two-component system cell cycle sensor histidine kinase/response regulator CckA
MNILYVEDDPQSVDRVRREFAQALPDTVLETVGTLRDAREHLTGPIAYDVLLLDLSLPDGGDGLNLIAELRAEARPLTIIVLIGSDGEETAVAAFQTGADDYIVKGKDYHTRLPGLTDAAFQRRRIMTAGTQLYPTLAVEGITRDVTGRKLVEERLYLQNAALNVAANGIVITNTDGIIEWINPAFTALTGYTMAEVIGRNPRELVRSGRHSREFYQAMWDTILDGRVWHGELINRRKDGSLYHEEQTITPLRDETGHITHFVAIKQDITARKQAEQENYLLLALPNAIADAPSLESALEAALSLVCEYADWDLGEVWVPAPINLPGSPEHLALLMQYHYEPEMDEAFRTFSQQFAFTLGDGLPGRVWRAQDVIWLPDIALEASFLRMEAAVQLGFRVAMGLPILLDGVVTAVMCFFLKGERQKDDRLVSLMSGVARQLAATFQRKQYQERLSESQWLAQATIDSLSAHIAVLDEEGVIIAVNQSWLDFAQANGAVLTRVGIGMNYLVVCAAAGDDEAADARQVAMGIRAVMRGELHAFMLEYPCHSPHAPRWFAVRVTPLPGNDPKRRRVVVTHENVTAHNLAVEALRDSEHHYRLLFDNNPQPMWVYDLETLAFLAVNAAAVARYGYTRQEFLEMTLKDIRPPEEVARLLADVAQTRPALQHSGEWLHQLQDGRIIDVEIASHTLTFNGRVAVLVVAFDITDRKQAAAQRLAQARRLQEILDAVPEGVVLLAEAGWVVSANPHGRELLFDLCGSAVGDRLEEINGRSLQEFLAPPGNDSRHTIQRGQRYFELLAQPIMPEAAGSNWVLLLRDVTAEHEREQYQQTQDRLATVGQLAAGIAHDFNNVMAVIILYAQLLQNVGDRSPDEQKKLTTIVNQAQHAADMVKQILDFSRRSVMDRTPIDVLPLLKEMVKLLRNTLPESIEITLTYDAGDYVVRADPTRLQQALMNAAVNARDAMPHGGDLHFALNRLVIAPGQPRPLPDVEPGHWLRIAIADTGSGIQSELLPYIFDPFFTTKGPGKGTGLGLAQMYGIVKQHDGSIGVVSSVGEGTTLTIYLPLFITGASALPGPETARSVLTGSETILLVEDNATLRESLSDVLAGLGYTVLRAENGVEALEVLLHHHTAVDLLLTDLVMPGMGGLDLYRASRRQYPELPLLVMTGYPPVEGDSELTGMAWIMKPFDTTQLAGKIRALLNAP